MFPIVNRQEKNMIIKLISADGAIDYIEATRMLIEKCEPVFGLKYFYTHITEEIFIKYKKGTKIEEMNVDKNIIVNIVGEDAYYFIKEKS
jgi:hypothetical protein